MTQHLEIEFKNMLTKQEYERLLFEFDITEKDIFTQENHYFDTTDFSLKEKGSALRIRLKNENFEMTLKTPAEVGLLETSQLITADEAKLAITTGKLPHGLIQQFLMKSNFPFEKLEYFGSLITKRAEFSLEEGLLVLDHSLYLNCEDFEMEFEVEEFTKGQEVFIQLLQRFNIPQRKTENKIRRFYNQKYSLK